jgi:hypothetical protein
MNLFDKLRESNRPSTRPTVQERGPSRWRIGNASVSTEELQAWQLGPLESAPYTSYAAPKPQWHRRG